MGSGGKLWHDTAIELVLVLRQYHVTQYPAVAFENGSGRLVTRCLEPQDQRALHATYLTPPGPPSAMRRTVTTSVAGTAATRSGTPST